ncbi:hypothetical protein SLAV_38980 [Streptomyces lavendulae subsp. lavendulae]|uniref:Uncharacterized protein n=1 Tax=Streptomyces lavendulae subsp. lavendulae TaxID=58340 RepID=A0A2K8P5I4_STRLA|nr:hypothetical protein SLAV_00410 [Streptomyces lavendulae subsp. lavendulae]ATZ29559.1 hypothetical protein SLAV_38980 [Streptomyces lavendulae subsp. lavendulae]
MGRELRVAHGLASAPVQRAAAVPGRRHVRRYPSRILGFVGRAWTTVCGVRQRSGRRPRRGPVRGRRRHLQAGDVGGRPGGLWERGPASTRDCCASWRGRSRPPRSISSRPRRRRAGEPEEGRPGADGWRPGAPYDVVLATFSVDHISPEWLSGLRPGGGHIATLWTSALVQLRHPRKRPASPVLVERSAASVPSKGTASVSSNRCCRPSSGGLPHAPSRSLRPAAPRQFTDDHDVPATCDHAVSRPAGAAARRPGCCGW